MRVKLSGMSDLSIPKPAHRSDSGLGKLVVVPLRKRAFQPAAFCCLFGQIDALAPCPQHRYPECLARAAPSRIDLGKRRSSLELVRAFDGLMFAQGCTAQFAGLFRQHWTPPAEPCRFRARHPARRCAIFGCASCIISDGYFARPAGIVLSGPTSPVSGPMGMAFDDRPSMRPLRQVGWPVPDEAFHAFLHRFLWFPDDRSPITSHSGVPSCRVFGAVSATGPCCVVAAATLSKQVVSFSLFNGCRAGPFSAFVPLCFVFLRVAADVQIGRQIDKTVGHIRLSFACSSRHCWFFCAGC